MSPDDLVWKLDQLDLGLDRMRAAAQRYLAGRTPYYFKTDPEALKMYGPAAISTPVVSKSASAICEATNRFQIRR